MAISIRTKDYRSDIVLTLHMTLGGETVNVPQHDFVLRFFTEHEARHYDCGRIKGEWLHCAPDESDATLLTCYIKNHGLGCGMLQCLYIDLSPNDGMEDGVQRTFSVSGIDLELVDDASDDTQAVDGTVVVDINAVLTELTNIKVDMTEAIAAAEAATASANSAASTAASSAMSANTAAVRAETAANNANTAASDATSAASAANDAASSALQSQQKNVKSIVYLGATGDGVANTVLITLNDDTKVTGSVFNGHTGAKGEDGVSVVFGSLNNGIFYDRDGREAVRSADLLYVSISDGKMYRWGTNSYVMVGGSDLGEYSLKNVPFLENPNTSNPDVFNIYKTYEDYVAWLRDHSASRLMTVAELLAYLDANIGQYVLVLDAASSPEYVQRLSVAGGIAGQSSATTYIELRSYDNSPGLKISFSIDRTATNTGTTLTAERSTGLSTASYNGNTKVNEVSIAPAGVLTKLANGATTTYNLPSSSGTIALTSDIAGARPMRVTATWDASASTYVSGASVDEMYQSFYTDGKVLELHLVNGNYNGMVLTCHGGYTDGSVRHMKFSGVTDDWIVSCDVVGTAATVTYTSLFDIYEELNGKQDTISLGNKVDADFVEYRGADTSRLGNGDSMTEALQTLDAAITNLGTPNEIASITTQESSASGGNNVVTITDTDGTSTSFNVKNGKDGKDGADGADGVSLGEIALVQTTGDATDEVMSQKAVTEKVERLTEEDLEQSIAVKRLPEGYEMLDYIINGTATGSCAAIDTGLLPNDDDWQFKGSWARNGNIGNWGRIIESYYTDATYCYRLCANGASVDNIYANAYSRANSGTVVPLSDSNVDVWHTYDLSHGKLVLDGVEHEISTVSASASPNTLKIGHVNYPQKTGVFSAYHNGELVAYMVPCKHGDDVGMYDLVREQFYTSSNANTFSAGAVVVEPADRLLDGEHLAGMIEQQTGNSDFKLMSQAAISEQVERLDVDTLDSTTEQLKRVMTKQGWVFGKTLSNTGALVDGANYCTSPFLSMENPLSHSITLAKGNTAGQQAVWYDENQVKVYNLTYSASPYTLTLTNANFTNAKYVRLSFSIANLRDCYLRDNTGLKYIIKMDDYIDEVLGSQSFIIDLNALSALITNEAGEERSKLMSQYGDMVNNYTTKKPTYIQGRLCYYRLADYPQLDPRTADGISIAFAKNEAKAAKTPMFDIWPNTAFSTKHFGLWYWDGFVKFGFFSSYGAVTTGGYSFGSVKGHYVLTYNFKTGEVKCYRNGVLYSTQTPASWDEQTMIRDYFESCTHITVSALKHADRQKMNGIAVFGTVLTDDDVADLYGSGNESIRGVLIQAKWQANALHPIYPNLGVAVRSSGGFSVTKETDGSSTIQWSGSGSYTWLDFGFFGLNGLVLNNATLDWDFEITSGSIVYKGGSYDRTYHGNALGNNYAKDVYTIFDANGNDVTTSDLGIGTYHVTAKPNHVAIGFHDFYDIQNGYVFTGCSEDIAINIKKTVKVAERGAALECSITNYAGAFWKLANGIELPFHSGAGGTYETTALYVGTDTYIEDTVIYKSSVLPQFNGQMAVDPEAGKVYIGYLTGTGGTWKQVSN